MRPEAAHSPPALEVCDLILLAGTRPLGAPLSFALAPGSWLGVTGPSGAGKSTLLRTIARLVPAGGGQLRLNGRSANAIAPATWRRQVAYVPQHPPALPSSAADFSRSIASLASQKHAPQALLRSALALGEQFHLKSAAFEMPFSSLSGGERQRAYLALVLATEPELLLLDEPTSALDDRTRSAVEERLLPRCGLLISHDLRQLDRLAEHVLTLSLPQSSRPTAAAARSGHEAAGEVAE